VTQIGLSTAALGQFDPAPMLDVAALLADARVAASVWNGRAGAWLGFANNTALSAAISRRTGLDLDASFPRPVPAARDRACRVGDAVHGRRL